MSKRRPTPKRSRKPSRLGTIGVGRALLADILAAPVPPLGVRRTEDKRRLHEGEGIITATYRDKPRKDWAREGRLGKSRFRADRDRAFVVWETKVHHGSYLGTGGRDQEDFEASEQWAAASDNFLTLGASIEEYIGPDAFAFGIQFGTRVLVLAEDGDEQQGEWLDLEWVSVVSTVTELDFARTKLGVTSEMMGDLGRALGRILKSAAGQLYVEQIAVYVTAKHEGAKARAEKSRAEKRRDAARARRAREKAAREARKKLRGKRPKRGKHVDRRPGNKGARRKAPRRTRRKNRNRR